MARVVVVAIVVGATLCSCAVIVWSARPPTPALPLPVFERLQAGRSAPPAAAAEVVRPATVVTPSDGVRWSPITVQTGPHFRVACDFANQAMAAAALDAAEAAWPATLAVFGDARPAPLDRPLEIRILRTREAYVAVYFALNSLPFQGHMGFACGRTRTAYVALDCVDPDDDVLTRNGMGSRATGAVAHEAGHLVASLCVHGSFGWCPWFDEGLAQRVEESVLLGGEPTLDEVAEQPRFATAMAACRRLLRDGLLPDPRAILARRVERFDTSDEYAVAWAFFRFLHEPAERGRTKQLIDCATRLAGGPECAAGLEKLFAKIWGDAGLDELAAAWPQYVAALAPQWEEIAGGRLYVADRRWMHVARPNQAACVWRVPRTGRTDYVVSGTFTILPRGEGALAVLLGRTSSEGMITVLLGSTEGVSVYECVGEPRGMRPLTAKESVRPTPGKRTAFEIRVSGDELRLSLDGREVLRSPLGGHDMTGPWGLIASGGSAGMWENVELK